MFEKKKYRIVKGQKFYVRGEGAETTVFLEGQIVKLLPHQAKAFKDKIIPIEETLDEIAKQGVEAKAGPNFSAKHAGGGRWNVLNNETGAPVNVNHLKKSEAEEGARKLNDGVTWVPDNDEDED